MLTVAQAKWRSLSDATLIAHAQGRYEVFITIDRGFEHEHNLKRLSFGIDRVKAGEIIHVSPV